MLSGEPLRLPLFSFKDSKMIIANPLLVLLLIVAIGVAVGILMYRYAGSNWLAQLTGTRRAYVTSALVGVAGSFIGYHISTIAGAGSTGIALILAAVFAALVVWIWRTARI